MLGRNYEKKRFLKYLLLFKWMAPINPLFWKG